VRVVGLFFCLCWEFIGLDGGSRYVEPPGGGFISCADWKKGEKGIW